ncbi:Purple acid phosphatase 18 [Dendrobium catenatum]|uniref:Purple acid phosphatase 18 n=1 Tax=Dendrobium catenatum TaxID=906689 RepID=A0A2I0WI45_9ASPA|nr:Purple acid phosphatase 18 [Dendrobium catenatum]
MRISWVTDDKSFPSLVEYGTFPGKYTESSEPEFQFKTPPSKFPLTFAVVGDLGQTDWTASTLSHINDCQYDLHLLPGDLSYADYLQHLWDSFGELIQPYASARSWMVTEGNHEMESIPFIAESGSTSNLYYSFEVAGVHVIMLGSYTDYGEYSDQYAWLKAEFECPYWFPTKVQKTDVVNAD